MATKPAVDWLLEDDQPAIRYRTLTELLGRPERDPDVREAKARIPRVGWAAEILSRAAPAGWWDNAESHYLPKYLATNWQMLMLSDLGLGREEPRLRRSVRWWRGWAKTRFGGNKPGQPHHCVVGNMARALIRFGYADDPGVRKMLDWLVSSADPKGGWSCWGKGRNLDSWEGLSALAAYPRAKWTAGMQRAVEAGAEFYLERELHRQGDRYPPWYRFHYPTHYYYDLLVGLDLVTSLGYGSDPRLRFALRHLARKRRADGRWNVDAVQPDVVGGMARWYRAHPKHRPTPTALEVPGRPSKMVTLTALKVRARVGA